MGTQLFRRRARRLFILLNSATGRKFRTEQPQPFISFIVPAHFLSAHFLSDPLGKVQIEHPNTGLSPFFFAKLAYNSFISHITKG